jgi:cobalamin biosynthesis protein CbiD
MDSVLKVASPIRLFHQHICSTRFEILLHWTFEFKKKKKRYFKSTQEQCKSNIQNGQLESCD